MKTYVLAWLLWIFMFSFAHAQVTTNHSNDSNATTLVCVPFGSCEACPEDALHEPFCQPFGNRRLMHCIPASSSSSASQTSLPHVHDPNDAPKGEIPAWESCGRIVEKERADFYEFFACNLFLGILAITVFLARSKRIQAVQARHLAARIGLVRSVPAGWSNG